MANTNRFRSGENDLFDQLMQHMMRPMREAGEGKARPIPIDVRENDAEYVVHAEIPGARKEDIQVHIDGNTVAIRVEIRNEKDAQNQGRALSRERYFGALERAFSLATDVDDTRAQARYEQGVLELRLPKKKGGPGRSLEIG